MGTSPTKFAHKFILIFGKNSKSKKIEKYFSILGQKIMQIDVIWSQEYGKRVFLSKNKFKKISIFGLLKIFKIFSKKC